MSRFGVYYLRLLRHGRAAIGGRVYEGSICVGDVAVMSKATNAPNLELESLTVKFEVEEIVAYRHNLESIDEGMTCEIIGKGEGIFASLDADVVLSFEVSSGGKTPR